VLLALLDRPGDVVTREDLRDRLWKSDTFVDFEHSLNTAVKKLRQALGDSAEAPTFVETLPRRGYRFIASVAPVTTASEEIPSLPDAAVPLVAAQTPKVNRTALLVTALVTVVLLAGLAWRVQSRPRTTTQLAVMPFKVLADPGGDAAYLGIGIADAITTRLAATRQIGVRPTSVVLPFAASAADPAALAAEVGVQHLVVGTIQPNGAVFRVTVQLVRSDGVAIWGQTYDEHPATLLDLQDRLAEQVVAKLRIELAGADLARLHIRYTSNPDAYDHYLRGRSLLVNYTEANMLSAIEHFEQAVSLDPNYALARAGIATACAWFSVRYAHLAEEITWAKRADIEAKKALAQDGSLAEAHLAIASAAGTAYGGWDWKVLLERTATALAIDPSLEFAHLARMRAFYHLGLFDAAADEGRAAVRLNPAHSVEFDRLDVALMLFRGEFKAAVERSDSLLKRTEMPAVRQYLGLARYYTGDVDGARAMLGSIMRADRPDIRAQASLASIEAASKRRTEALERIAEIRRVSDLDHHVTYSLGAAYSQLGQPEESIGFLEQAADEGFPCYPWFERDPLLDPIRKNPRFIRLLARLQEAHREMDRLQR
jgi:DNA-binding winged helix-turn-helix (wHTH) protein/TolB-like protein/Tfp pilus assembly protein PilF